MKLKLLMTGILFLLCVKYLYADQITVYFYPPPMYTNWKSPYHLLRTTFQNQLLWRKGHLPFQHPMGHANVEILCAGNSTNEEVDILTGMTMADPNENVGLLLKKKYGLGIFYHVYKGKLLEKEKLRKELEKRYKTGKMSFITFQVSQKTCRRAAAFVREYDERDYDKMYGMHNRIRYGEGSNCTGLAMAVLEIAGLLNEEFKEKWWHVVRVPIAYVGGPVTGKKVSMWRLLFPYMYGLPDKWAKENEPHTIVSWWDQDIMHRWVLARCDELESELGSESAEYKLEKRGKARGLFTDKSLLPTPTEPFWKHE